MNLFNLKPHPFSQIFPNENDGAFSELVASVKKLGRLRNAVIVYDNQILDGNRRLRACKIAKVEPKFIEFKGDDAAALEVVWDLNYNRRHLTESQRSFAFAEYCRFLDHGQHPDESGHVTTLDEAAEKVNVGKSTMQRAKVVAQHGTKEQKESVRAGKATVAKVASDIRAQSSNGSVDVDETGVPIPKPAKRFWDRRDEAKQIISAITKAKSAVKALRSDDPMWSEVNLNGVLSDLSNAFNRFRAAVPAHVCPYCQGANPDKCTACKGRGVISDYMWKVAVPVEIKQMRENKP